MHLILVIVELILLGSGHGLYTEAPVPWSLTQALRGGPVDTPGGGGGGYGFFFLSKLFFFISETKQ